MKYYISDLHLGHYNIMRLCNRPFESTEENTTNGTCTADYGKWYTTCAPYTSGIHGGYAYKKAENPIGASCTGMNSLIEYYSVERAKFTYKCN